LGETFVFSTELKKKLFRRLALDGLLDFGYKLEKFQPRPMIKACQKHFGSQSIKGCEIGVWMGDHAVEIKKSLNCELYLIDPYKEYEKYRTYEAVRGYEDYRQSNLDTAKSIARWRLDRVWTTRDKLPEMDFIYIDANHSYKYVMKDIKLALSKVKSGIIGGHDYSTDYPGVIQAVNERFSDFQFKGNDWWVII